MNNVYTIIIEKDEDGWFEDHAPALPGCHLRARSIDEFVESMTQTITLWLEVEAGRGAEIAEVGRNLEIGRK